MGNQQSGAGRGGERGGDKNKEKERASVDDLRGMPMPVASLEEIIDDDNVIIAPHSGIDYYVPILSIVDRD